MTITTGVGILTNPRKLKKIVRLHHSAMPHARHGDVVHFAGHGTIVDEDGKKYIHIHSIDGHDLPKEHEEELDMDSEDALSDFISNKKKRKD